MQALLDTPADEQMPTVSPDGGWLAYVSDETGGPEVYAQRFPEGGQRQRISTGGGTKPLWSPQGAELFYVRDSVLMMVPVELEPELAVGTPTALFEATQDLAQPPWQGLQDISRDGQRFLAVLPREDVPEAQFIFVQNWFEELKVLADRGGAALGPAVP